MSSAKRAHNASLAPGTSTEEEDADASEESVFPHAEAMFPKEQVPLIF